MSETENKNSLEYLNKAISETSDPDLSEEEVKRYTDDNKSVKEEKIPDDLIFEVDDDKPDVEIKDAGEKATEKKVEKISETIDPNEKILLTELKQQYPDLPDAKSVKELVTYLKEEQARRNNEGTPPPPSPPPQPKPEKEEVVYKETISQIKNDGVINSILARLGRAELPTSSEEEWSEFCKEEPYYSRQIESRIAEIKGRVSTNYDKQIEYDTKVPVLNKKILQDTSIGVGEYMVKLFPQAKEEDFIPVVNELKKFLNNGNMPEEFYEKYNQGDKTYFVLNKDKIIASFLLQNSEKIKGLMEISIGKNGKQQVKDTIKKIKDGTSAVDLGSKGFQTEARKRINPLDRKQVETLSLETLNSLIDKSKELANL